MTRASATHTLMRKTLHASGLFMIELLFVTGVLLAQPLAVTAESKLTGTIKADGSSTVYPITEAVAEEFARAQDDVKVTVGISGTGGGFKKFCAGETDISDASRPIKTAEIELCSKNGVEYVELPVAYDAITVVVNPKNSWAQAMTVEELKKLWEPEAQGKITTWKQVREDWPDKPIRLFGPGVDSGTYDYFTEAVCGKEDASRGDYTSSEDDNVLVQGVANDPNALGFFGLAYYEENMKKLKALKIDDQNDANGVGAIAPSASVVVNGTYVPLSRPLFIYVRKNSLERPEVQAFVDFYMRHGADLAGEVGYVQLPPAVHTLALARLKDRVLGSIFGGQPQVGAKLEDLLKKSSKA